MSSVPTLQIDVRLELDSFTLALSETFGKRVAGIFGASGSGKTTLLQIIAGVCSSASGRVVFGEQVWQDSAAGIFVPPEKRQIGYVPQNDLLFPHLTVEQNLTYGRHRFQRGEQEYSELLQSIVQTLELKPLLHRKPIALSGGERQRVALGRALGSAPRLLLMDESLAATDEPLRYRILPMLCQLREELGIPMLWVSHSPIEVQAIGDDLIVLQQGKRLARGEPRTVLTNPGVFPLAESQGFENVFPCRFVSSDARQTIVNLGYENSDVNLVVSSLASNSIVTSDQTNHLVSLSARSIFITTERPQAISAQNVLPAKVLSQEPLAGIVLLKVELAASLPPLVIEVTYEACESLQLVTGREIFVIAKATACRLLS